jgi:membrane protease YdiL (CAAX protease family)
MARGSRTRLDVLIGEARIVGALIVAFSWPLLCVRGTWVVLHRVAFATAASHLASGAAILFLISFATLVTRPVDRLRAPATWVGTVGVLVPSFISFLILAGAVGTPIAVLLAPFALATFAAALAEEAVFRRYLPDRLAAILRCAGARPAVSALAIVVIPQLSFAMAHAENSAFARAGVREFAGLFIGGVLYQAVTRVGGLWAAAAVHAALNLTIAIAAVPARAL